MISTSIHTAIVVFCLLFASPTTRAALIPALSQTSIAGQSVLLSLESKPIPSATAAVEESANQAAGLNQLSLADTLLILPSSTPDSVLKNIFNGINVAFPTSNSLVLANLASNANQILPTASTLLQVTVASLLLSTYPTSQPLLTAASILTSDIIQDLPASCVDIFNIGTLPPSGKLSTLITLQPACSPLSVFVDNETGTTPASTVQQPTTVEVTNLTPQNGLVTPTIALSSGSISTLGAALATINSPATGNMPLSALPSVSLGPPIVGSITTLPQAAGSILALASSSPPLLPCIRISNSGPATCSLLPGSVQPVNGNRPCGTCPINAGLQGVGPCPWLCSISFFGTSVYSCSPIDVTGQTFPDSGALNISNHLAEAVCHQCAAPCQNTTTSTNNITPAYTAVPATIAAIALPAPSSGLSCTVSADSPCCEPYGSRGNIVCSACPVDPAVLAVCPWLCRMPYVQGRIDLECSPIDLTGINLLSPYNETVQCERCRPGCSSYRAIAATTTCTLSTTISNPLSATSLSPLLPATRVSSTAPTCTDSAPGSPSVTCTGGPDFSTLYCPQGCPSIFTSQCAFFCTSNFGNGLGGLFPAIQCAPVDLSLISPGSLSCQQCFPQCNNSSSANASTALTSAVLNSTAATGTVSIIAPSNTTPSIITLSTTSSAASSATCAIFSPGAVDTPASQDTATGLLFRSSCGISVATVAQCPFLCSQGGAAFFQECSNVDISGQQPTGQFPPIECTHCLPPCGNGSATSFTSPLSGFILSTTASVGPSAGNSSTSSLFPTASMTAPLPNVSAFPLSSGSSNQSTLGTVLTALADLVSSSTVFSITSGGALIDSTSLASSTVTTLGTSVSSSSSALINSVLASSASASSNTSDLDISSITLTSSIAASLSSAASIFTGSVTVSSTMASATPSTSASATLTATSSSAPTCTQIIPSGTDTPAIIEPNTGLIVRSSCGFTAETITQCPFICSAGGGAPNGNCSTEDMTGRLMYGSYPPIVCHQCLPPCEDATTAPAGPTCSSVAPNSPDPTALIDLSGLLHRDSCGTSASTVAKCPYLCGLSDQGIISRQCFYQDLTNKTIAGQAADIGLLACEKCLPPCGNSAMPSCSNRLLSDVNSIVGALPATIPGLVGSLQIQPFIGAIPTSLTSIIGSVAVQSIIGAIPTTLPAAPVSIEVQSIAGAIPISIPGIPTIVPAVVKPNEALSIIGAIPVTLASIKAAIPKIALNLPGSIQAQPVVGAVSSTILGIVGALPTVVPVLPSANGAHSVLGGVPTTIQALAGSIEAGIPTSLAAHPVLGSIIAPLPNTANPETPQLPASAAPPVGGSKAASLPVNVVPSSQIVPVQPSRLLPPIMAERDTPDAFWRRDVVNTIVDGSPAAQLQLTCGDTSEAVAACPFLCSPMNGGIQGFRRCTAVDLTNNFIGVDRVTCEKCLPSCLD